MIESIAAQGTTMVIVTHEMQFAHDGADLIVVMDQGMSVEKGAPDEVFFRPKRPKTYALLRRSGLTVEPPGTA